MKDSQKTKLIRENKAQQQEGLCGYCKSPLEPYLTHLDHIIPKSHGGDNSEDNLISVCVMCNMKKGPSTIEEWIGRVHRDFMRAKREMEYNEIVLDSLREMLDKRKHCDIGDYDG